MSPSLADRERIHFDGYLHFFISVLTMACKTGRARFTSANSSGTHTHPRATQFITQSSVSFAGSPPHLALDFPVPIWEPFPRRGRHWVFGALAAMVMGDMWLMGRSGEETRLLLLPQPPLISHQPKTKYQARGSLGLAKCSCSYLLGRRRKPWQLELNFECLQKKFCMGGCPEALQF